MYTQHSFLDSLDGYIEGEKIYVSLPCCSSDNRARLADVLKSSTCPNCGTENKMYLGDIEKSDDTQTLSDYLYHARRVRTGVYLEDIDTEVDEGISHLVQAFIDEGFQTKLSCSGLLREHYLIDNITDKFEEEHILDKHHNHHTRPFVTVGARYHNYNNRMEVSEEFYEFVDECVLASNFNINIQYLGSSSARYTVYRDTEEPSNKADSIEEFDEILSEDIRLFSENLKNFNN